MLILKDQALLNICQKAWMVDFISLKFDERYSANLNKSNLQTVDWPCAHLPQHCFPGTNQTFTTTQQSMFTEKDFGYDEKRMS